MYARMEKKAENSVTCVTSVTFSFLFGVSRFEREAMSDAPAFRYLLDLARALRLAQKVNLATGDKPDPVTAKRL
jgi:hypothetical protein